MRGTRMFMRIAMGIGMGVGIAMGMGVGSRVACHGKPQEFASACPASSHTLVSEALSNPRI